MFKTNLFTLALGLLIFLTGDATASLPYNPTFIGILSSQNQSRAYLLLPKPEAPSEFKLLSLELSSAFDVSEPPFFQLSSSVPFVTRDDTKAFIPAVGIGDVLSVYSGNCRTGLSDIWHFSPEIEASRGNGTWQKLPMSQHDTGGGGTVRGPNYLSSGITYFMTDEPSRVTLFVFGGMCPTTDGSGGDWVSAANYSQTMLSLSTDLSTPDMAYEVGVAAMRGPPVAGAGFAMTPLIPAFSNTSAGKQLRKQSFVLVGGHTQQAFINMSQIALFSLPEMSWSYIPVSQGGREAESELPFKDAIMLEPRSGHTSVLTADGTKIIVFGGWVGDISVPAQPQLVVLEVGEEYGGLGKWSWTAPQQEGHGLEDGTGIFGHGAAMLPGGIMLVAGGYEIPQTSSKRSTTNLTLNSRTYLFDTSSNSWITSYPGLTLAEGVAKSSSDPLSSASQKVGLGVGLGVGLLAAAAGIFTFCCICSRRSRKHRSIREQALRQLALGAERPHFSAVNDTAKGFDEPMIHLRSENPNSLVPSTAYPWMGSGGFGSGHGWQESSTSLAERTSLLVEIPSPTRGHRKFLHSRGYQLAGSFDDTRRNRGFNNIHRIDERDEYEETATDGMPLPGSDRRQRSSKSSIASDPFADPPTLQNHPSPNGTQPQISTIRGEYPEIHDWVDKFESAVCKQMANTLGGQRSISPDKSDRTLSSLSEVSAAGVSLSSQRTSPASLRRTLSQKSAARFQHSVGHRFDMCEASRNLSLEDPIRECDHAHCMNASSSGVGILTETGELMSERVHKLDSSVLRTSFPQLQAEAGSLLGMRPTWDPSPEPPTKSLNGSKGKALGWIGNVKRALGSVMKAEDVARSYSASPETVTSGQRSLSSSPTKGYYGLWDDGGVSPDAGFPRRAVSASSTILRRKQGAKDWGVTKRSSVDSTKFLRHRTPDGSAALAGSNRSDGRSSASPDLIDYDYDDDEEWDVEAAAEGRLVQVTFTVPKEKLRVVNAGTGDDNDDDDGDRGNDALDETSLKKSTTSSDCSNESNA